MDRGDLTFTRNGRGSILTPFLEKSHPLALTVEAPEVATAAGAVATVPRPVVAVAAPFYAGASKQMNQRGTLLLGRSH